MDIENSKAAAIFYDIEKNIMNDELDIINEEDEKDISCFIQLYYLQYCLKDYLGSCFAIIGVSFYYLFAIISCLCAIAGGTVICFSLLEMFMSCQVDSCTHEQLMTLVIILCSAIGSCIIFCPFAICFIIKRCC